MKHFEDAAARAVWALRAAQLSLDMELFIKATADETSLLFADADELKQFVRWAEQNGMEHFNRVESDRMVRVDRNATEGFDVRFEFLRWPDQPWRIEAMCVLDGQAPLHEAHLETHGSAKPVHVSFKCDTLPAYNNMKRTMADDGVEQIPFHAEYRNSYGLFSYWGVGNFYLKPRVNLRDPQ